MAHSRRRLSIHQSCISSDTANLRAHAWPREGSHVSSPFSWPRNILKQKQIRWLLLTEGTPLSFHTTMSSHCSLDFPSSAFTRRQHGDQKRRSKVTSSLQGRLISILWDTANSAFTASLRKFCSWSIADQQTTRNHPPQDNNAPESLTAHSKAVPDGPCFLVSSFLTYLCVWSWWRGETSYVTVKGQVGGQPGQYSKTLS